MNGDKIRKFMTLAGQPYSKSLREGSPEERALGAQLLLSEVLEYVIEGLGVIPEVQGVKITEANNLHYKVEPGKAVDQVEMLDGLADVAYTMYWNAHAFGVPLEAGFDLVCDNNLEKFVNLPGWTSGAKILSREEWDCGRGISWPAEVAKVEVIQVEGDFYAVGKDARGKVRKPSSYKSVDLTAILNAA